MSSTKFVIQIAGLVHSGKTSTLLALAMQGASANYMEHALALTDEPFTALEEDYIERRYDPELGIRIYTHKAYNLMVGVIEAPVTPERLRDVLQTVTVQTDRLDRITRLYLDIVTLDVIDTIDACLTALKGTGVELQAYTRQMVRGTSAPVKRPLQITATSSTGYL